MRNGLLIVLVALCTGCGSSPDPPQNCKVAEKQAFQCLERNGGKSHREMLLACLPFSKPERISGAWVFGFETNHFFEGEQASLEHKGRTSTTKLEPGLELGLDTRPKPYQVEVVGRRSQCDMGFPRNIILVDRVIAKQELLERQ